MVKRLDKEQERLVLVDLKILIYHPLELNRVALDLVGFDAMFNFADRTEQTASVDVSSVRFLASVQIQP